MKYIKRNTKKGSKKGPFMSTQPNTSYTRFNTHPSIYNVFLNDQTGRRRGNLVYGNMC